MKYAIEVNKLRKEFGLKTAVKDISFQVQEKTLFSLLGVNGAGKTTTIRMLTGLSRPTSGDAFVLGHSITTDLNEVKKVSNVSTQDTAVAPNLTVRENLEFMAGIYNIDKKQIQERTNEMIQLFSLQEVENSKAKTLSGGWQRKLSIAMALITDPKVLYLDEPTLGLDVLARKDLWRIIEGLKKKVTIILTTHYMEEAEHLSDAIAVMVGGEIKALGTLEDLKKLTGKDNLEDAFVEIAEGGL
ncbi:MAG: ATP-binding cassette domain-containing protein [Lachnospiraceae bacterium]|nr:ATP-binding cassette domain-containing protein [Lachnospiraceae bacterium]